MSDFIVCRNGLGKSKYYYFKELAEAEAAAKEKSKANKAEYIVFTETNRLMPKYYIVARYNNGSRGN